MAFKIILGKGLVEAFKATAERGSLEELYASASVLILGSGVEVVRSGTGTVAVVAGAIMGIREGDAGLDLVDRDGEQYRNALCTLPLDRCKKDFEGRYILIRIQADGRIELSPDRFGQMELYYQKVGEGYVLGTSLGLLPFKDETVRYDQFGLAVRGRSAIL